MRDCRLLCLVALLAFPPLAAAALADVVRLKNGGTITCDQITERGDDLILRQGTSTIVVPRRDVVSIERLAAPPASPKPAPAPTADNTGASAGGGFNRDQALKRLDELKHSLEQSPAGRDETRKQIVALLARLGEDDLTARRADEARRRFEEALSQDGRDLRSARGLAAANLLLGQDALARSVLERALLDAPNDADLNLLLGEVAHRQDRLDEALAAWQKSYAAKPNDALRGRIDTLQRQLQIEQGYRRSDAVHFTVRYDGERTGPDLEGSITDELEKQFPDLARRFDHVPPLPISVVIYPQRAFYDATQVDSNVIGLYDGKIRVPSGGLRQLDAEARSVLLHELAHVFITSKSGGRAPRWMQEGLAQWIEGKRTPPGTARQLADDWKRRDSGAAWGSTFTDVTALSFVEFLAEREGFNEINEMLGAMGRGQEAGAAIQGVTRDPLPDLLDAWGADLARRHLQ